jgi:hypothetical protein
MAKLFKIELTEAGKTIGDKEGNLEIRAVELAAVSSCIIVAASKEKSVAKYNLASDLHRQIEEKTLDKSDEICNLTKDDIEVIKAGFAAISEGPQGKPGAWVHCRKLWEQIENPKEQTEADGGKTEISNG